MLDALAVQRGNNRFVMLSQFFTHWDERADRGNEQGINLFQKNFISWHYALLFNLAKPCGYTSKTCLLYLDHVFSLSLFKCEHYLQLVQREIFLEQPGYLFQRKAKVLEG